MESFLPQGPPYFPEDAVTDLTERFIAAEMIRETVFRLTGEEIPYATAVTVDSFTEEKNGKLVKIEASIHIERASQKHDALTGVIKGKMADEKGFEINLKRVGENLTEVGVRIGTFGDRERSEAIHNKIHSML